MFFILFFFIFMPIVLFAILNIYKDHKKVTNGVVNYDSHLNKFLYKVNFTKDEIIEKLQERDVADYTYCTYDYDTSILRYVDIGQNKEFYLNVRKVDGLSILILEGTAFFQNLSIYEFNMFIVRKLQAEAIPYSKYGHYFEK